MQVAWDTRRVATVLELQAMPFPKSAKQQSCKICGNPSQMHAWTFSFQQRKFDGDLNILRKFCAIFATLKPIKILEASCFEGHPGQRVGQQLL